MCIAAAGIIDGMNADLVDSVTRVESGDVQVHAPDYLARRQLTLTIPDGTKAAEEAEKAFGVEAASPRAYAWALASKGDQSVGIQLLGIDPAREGRVTVIASKLTEGQFVPTTPTPWPPARALTAEEKARDAELTEEEKDAALAEIDALDSSSTPHVTKPRIDDAKGATKRLVREISPPPDVPPPVVLGAKLAHRLHVKVGDRVALMGQDANGSPADVEFAVVGTFTTGTTDIDSSRALANLTDVQRFAALGPRVHELALRTAPRADVKNVAHQVGELPGMKGLEVKAWSELRPDVLAMLTANASLMQSLVSVVFVVSAIGVINTMLMAIFERKRELAVLKAVGMRPMQILTMVVVETTILGILASMVGVAAGVGLDLYLAKHGLNLSGVLGNFSLAGVGFKPILHAHMTEEGVGTPIFAMIFMAILASLYPAIRAARVQPAVGMRDNG